MTFFAFVVGLVCLAGLVAWGAHLHFLLKELQEETNVLIARHKGGTR